MEVTRIIVNWFSTTENGEEYSQYVVGKIAGPAGKILRISDQRKNDDGMVILFEDGSVTREFNINSIDYSKPK